MKIKLIISFLLTLLFHLTAFSQPKTYGIKKADFSSDQYDEFSPVYYKNGIVFTTSRTENKIMNYSSAQDKGLLKINYIDTTGVVNWKDAVIFSKELKTKFNDGPVTFSKGGDTIYFSRNQIVDGKFDELSSSRNKLGIFTAVHDNGNWIKIRDLRINNEWFNNTTPCLSPDGKRLYFASDRPGGQGGSDLYYSERKGDFWEDPVNLGPVINTKGNEAYPFINEAGELFFSSDALPGLGGKDIFFTRIVDGSWATPIGLDAPINSKSDDFGIVTNRPMDFGYFSTNRGRSVDIYKFKTISPQVLYSSIQKENQYCFRFDGLGSIDVDTVNMTYMWYFGDDSTGSGPVVDHCFSGPGEYPVRLDIVETKTGRLFFTKLMYTLKLNDFEQPYISSDDEAIKGEKIEFDALKSFLPGKNIISYAWDFGDGGKSSGEKVTHSYSEKGEYLVNLDLRYRSDSKGTVGRTGVSKKISVVAGNMDRFSLYENSGTVKGSLSAPSNNENITIVPLYSSEEEFKKDAVFVVELLSAKNKVDMASSEFKKVARKYTIRERVNPLDSVYSYTVEQQLSLMATYPAFKELTSLGFEAAKVKLLILEDPAEKELHNLIKINGAYADTYFDKSEMLTSNAYIMLDQIVRLMNKYPEIRLEVAVHTDNTTSAEYGKLLTQNRSRMLVNYLIDRGINSKRLVATGFGDTKPIAPNNLAKEKKLNRRIDFIIIKY
jgi:outer membrane protein OmpA-like peptidoglycan-associated protein